MAVYLPPVQGTFRWPCDDDIAWDLTSVECRCRYLSFMMSGLTGVGTAGKGYYANQLLGAGSAYMSSQIEGQDSTASVR
ncbi:hypothetical protein F6S90_05300 [Escherichia coli]|nr:hypothetical protein [Escherichia coli]